MVTRKVGGMKRRERKKEEERRVARSRLEELGTLRWPEQRRGVLEDGGELRAGSGGVGVPGSLVLELPIGYCVLGSERGAARLR